MTIELNQDGSVKWEKVSPRVKKIFFKIVKLSETNPLLALNVIEAINKLSGD